MAFEARRETLEEVPRRDAGRFSRSHCSGQARPGTRAGGEGGYPSSPGTLLLPALLTISELEVVTPWGADLRVGH